MNRRKGNRVPGRRYCKEARTLNKQENRPNQDTAGLQRGLENAIILLKRSCFRLDPSRARPGPGGIISEPVNVAIIAAPAPHVSPFIPSVRIPEQGESFYTSAAEPAAAGILPGYLQRTPAAGYLPPGYLQKDPALPKPSRHGKILSSCRGTFLRLIPPDLSRGNHFIPGNPAENRARSTTFISISSHAQPRGRERKKAGTVENKRFPFQDTNRTIINPSRCGELSSRCTRTAGTTVPNLSGRWT